MSKKNIVAFLCFIATVIIALCIFHFTENGSKNNTESVSDSVTNKISVQSQPINTSVTQPQNSKTSESVSGNTLHQNSTSLIPVTENTAKDVRENKNRYTSTTESVSTDINAEAPHKQAEKTEPLTLHSEISSKNDITGNNIELPVITVN